MKQRFTRFEWVLMGVAALSLATLLFLLILRHSNIGTAVTEKLLVLGAQTSIIQIHAGWQRDPRTQFVFVARNSVQLNFYGYPIGPYNASDEVPTLDCIFVFNMIFQPYSSYSVGELGDERTDYFYVRESRKLFHQVMSEQSCYYVRNGSGLNAKNWSSSGVPKNAVFSGIYYNAESGEVSRFTQENVM